MKVKEIINEAAMSVPIQAKYPVSAGARGLMGARWRYDTVVKNQLTPIMSNALDHLESQLKKISFVTDQSVEQMLSDVCYKFRIDPEVMYQHFRKKYNCSPSVYALKYKKSRAGKPANI